jgi:hypothetical protein
MLRSRPLIFSFLVLALTMSLSVPVTGSSYKGEVTNYDDNGICYWKCYSSGLKAYSAPATDPGHCLQLCAQKCFGPCYALY